MVQEFRLAYATDKVDWWAFVDVSDYKGKKLTVKLEGGEGISDEDMDIIHQTNKIKGWRELYKEKGRPQFHFTSRRGWNNDSNGLVYYKGLWHLFYQHNPFSRNWGNMHWGHAVSSDLLHWEELGDALYPDELGVIFSGSAVVDFNNSAGFQTGNEKTMVCFYTSTDGTHDKLIHRHSWHMRQSIAYSNDRGRTWTKYLGNPIIENLSQGNRDPKVFWHEPTKRWVMVLYLDGGKHKMVFFTSTDLKNWTKHSELETKGMGECPELFELPIDGDKSNTKWVLYGGSGAYLIGHFDGRKFVPDGDLIKFSHGDCFYASQTWNDVPKEDGRRIQIGWARIDIPDMPFNQMMNSPLELTLRSTDDGIRVYAVPVREFENLRGKKHSFKNKKLVEGENLLEGIESEFFDIVAEIEVGDAKSVGLNVRGVEIVYDADKQELVSKSKEEAIAPLKTVDGKIKLRILADRGIREVFADDGRIYMPLGKFTETANKKLQIFARGLNAKVVSLDVYEMKSIWK
jgi:sucrose-6-phosphate hydrolase SacC (GH32 family)